MRMSCTLRKASANRYNLVSIMIMIMAKLRCRTLAEKALIPAFVFVKLYPPVSTNDSPRSTARAAEGSILLLTAPLRSAHSFSITYVDCEHALEWTEEDAALGNQRLSDGERRECPKSEETPASQIS